MIVVPLRTKGGLNNREHWRVAAKRKKAEAEAVALFLRGTPPPTPCVVTLTRIGPSNGLDDDNLAGSLKTVRDQVARWLGVDDRHRHIVRYQYEQERASDWAVRIQFAPKEHA